MAASPDGKRLVLPNGVLTFGPALAHVATGESFRLFDKEEDLSAAAFSSGGRMFAAASRSGTVKIQSGARSEEMLRLPEQSNRVLSFAFSPDEHTVAVAGKNGIISLWEIAGRQKRMTLKEHGESVVGLSFSPSGETLASLGVSGKVLLWNLRKNALGERISKQELSHEELEKLWNDLAASDSVIAYRAVWALSHSPNAALILERRLKAPAVPVSVARLIAGLDSDRFSVRAKSAKELEKRGAVVRESLQRALHNPVTLESRLRIELILRRLRDQPPTGEMLRSQRAVETLERMSSPPARRLLQRLANGPRGARLTELARRALERYRPYNSVKSANRPSTSSVSISSR